MTFRDAYLDHAALTGVLRAWAEQHAAHCRLLSIGKSGEGRDLWVLAVGREPERARPALWVDGNMHAMELTGSSTALGFAEELLAFHATGALPEGVPATLRDALADSLVYVMPRMSPDGAEAVLKTGRFVRSTPVDC
jgi:murein tripeptide amidase MpaA